MTNLADKIDALAEKATPGPWECLPEKGAENFANSIYAPLGAFDGLLLARVDQNGATNNAALIVELVNARETLTRALRDAERMREALGRIVHLGDTFRYESDEDVFRLVDDTQNCARAALGESHD